MEPEFLASEFHLKMLVGDGGKGVKQYIGLLERNILGCVVAEMLNKSYMKPEHISDMEDFAIAIEGSAHSSETAERVKETSAAGKQHIVALSFMKDLLVREEMIRVLNNNPDDPPVHVGKAMARYPLDPVVHPSLTELPAYSRLFRTALHWLQDVIFMFDIGKLSDKVISAAFLAELHDKAYIRDKQLGVENILSYPCDISVIAAQYEYLNDEDVFRQWLQEICLCSDIKDHKWTETLRSLFRYLKLVGTTDPNVAPVICIFFDELCQENISREDIARGMLFDDPPSKADLLSAGKKIKRKKIMMLEQASPEITEYLLQFLNNVQWSRTKKIVRSGV